MSHGDICPSCMIGVLIHTALLPRTEVQCDYCKVIIINATPPRPTATGRYSLQDYLSGGLATEPLLPSDGWRPGLYAEDEDVCECGAETAGSPAHAHYCPRHIT